MKLKSSLPPIPEVFELHNSTATKEVVVNALKISGVVIIRGLLKHEEMTQIEEDAWPWLEKGKP